jgi:DNA polymerase II large subunit
MEASSEQQAYSKTLNEEVKRCYKVATSARKKGIDPESTTSIPLAKNMAERVVGLISVVAPKIAETNVSKRILELEKKYGQLDWRVGFKIAEEVAKEKLCKFDDKLQAIEIGIRVGFAYLTLGIVSAPLEGFIGLKIKKRKDGKEYFALQYAGPIRGAGGTAASTSVILSDYVRVSLGYSTYDPSEEEINRYITEIHDYHERVTNLQYHPSDEEIRYLMSHLPVEVDGDPTEKFEVSNYKDLPRIETNLIRGGMALVLAEGLSQKAPKLWKRLSKWGKDFNLDWGWLPGFIELKEKIHSVDTKTGSEEDKFTIKANNTFIMDAVAGRPVLTHPLAVGGFRLRYGRTRASGFSAASVHPATLIVLNRYIGIGTQLKVERPGKAATITVCESLEGPIVLLKNGKLLQLKNEQEAKDNFTEIKEVVFLGDILFNYGDFSENGHRLVPAGYCPEWWILEAEKSMQTMFSNNYLEKAVDLLEIKKERLQILLNNPLWEFPTWQENLLMAKKLHIPLHPDFTFYWKLVKGSDLLKLRDWFHEGKVKIDEKGISKIVLPFNVEKYLYEKGKKVLEHLGVVHQLVNNESVVLQRKEAQIFACCFDFQDQKGLENINLEESIKNKDGLEVINFISSFTIRDKAGTFIGARMGRPEKAKMRLMTGSPQVMFPVGDEGNRLRSFQAALEVGKIRSVFPTYFCVKCEKNMVYRQCEECKEPCIKKYNCRFCGDLDKETCRHGPANPYKMQDLDIRYYFNKAKQRIKETIHADLIKGVRGTSNKEHVVEHLSKGILRAKHRIYVNKDGTTRYDATELPLTHFKPKEIHTSIEKLKELGYLKDIHGQDLENDNQLVELKAQDIVLPGFDSLDESGPKVLTRIANFVDDSLVNLYGQKSFYNIKKPEDLAGHLVIGLAPHISAGLIGRIIGFSETQGLFTHPMYHAGLRRDCFSANTYLPFFCEGMWGIERIGEIVEKYNPMKQVDKFGTKEVKVGGVKTIGKNYSAVAINNFTKHAPQSMLRIKTKLGRVLELTTNHKQIVYTNGIKKIVPANKLKVGDNLGIPYKMDVPKNDLKSINLYEALADKDWVMVRGVNKILPQVKEHARSYFSKSDFDNYTMRDSYPIKFIVHLQRKSLIRDLSKVYLAAKRDSVQLPSSIRISKEFLQLVGLYVAEGYSRGILGKLYQVYIVAQDKEIREFIRSNMNNIFGLLPTERKEDRLTYSSRILYHLFTSILKCGSYARAKRIPPLFLNLPKKKLGYMLSGYFEGDGSVSKGDLRVTFDTVSEGLLRDMDFVFAQMGIFVKNCTYTSKPGSVVREFYDRKGRPIPSFTVTKGVIQSVFVKKYEINVGFISSRKRKILRFLVKTRRPGKLSQQYDSKLVYDTIASMETMKKQITYCLNVPGHTVVANSILTKQCDGDEACVMLLMDALLNFSRQYLPERRGAKTMDSPLVLTASLNPAEIDDQVHGMDVVWKYPLELYQAAQEMKNPWEVKHGLDQKKIEQLGDRLNTPLQFEQFGFTHHVDNINKGVQCSAYKTIPSMEEKLTGQMDIAQKVRAVDMDDVARLVIQRHFLRDIKGNLRKFSMQQFRCVKCNEKFRRPPLNNICSACNGKLLFTITEGSVVKYLGHSLKLADNYDFSPYLKQVLNVIKTDVDYVFGKEKEKQVGLGSFIG